METEITDIGKVAITPRKDYKNEQTYEWLDVVTYNGASYMCIAEDGCTGIVPTNTDYWQLLADKGHFTEEDKEEFKKAVVEESKTEINEHTGNKKTELNNYTTELEKSLENELDTYKTEKETQMDSHKATLETEMANKKDSLIEEIETAQNGFDANAEEKTNTFNSNAETKTTEFNNNSNTKTEEFNNNSTEKINAFNSNAEEKIAEYDAHAESVLTETNDLFNALDTEKASGNELYIEDAKPCRIINTEISGMYKQETTKGTNIMNLNVAQSSKVTVNEDGTITINGTGGFGLSFESFTFKANIPYYIKWEIVSGNIPTDLSLVFLSSINSKWLTKDIFNTITPTEDKESSSLWIHQNAKFENAKIRIWISESQSDFEPYTGKIPSPNLDYPQAIEQVDSAKLQYTGSNLFDYTKISIIPSSTSGLVITLEKNGDITVSGKPKYSYTMVVPVQDITDILKDGETYYINQSSYNKFVFLEVTATKNNGSIIYLGTTVSEKKFVVNKTNFKKYTIKVVCCNLSTWGEEEKTITSNFKLTRQKSVPFEKYVGKAINIDLKGNKLCAVSDTIKDKLLIDRNGNVALQKNVGFKLLDGSENWFINDTSSSNQTHRFCFNLSSAEIDNFTIAIRSNSLISVTASQLFLNDIECISKSISQLLIRIDENRGISNVEQLKTWLASNNMKVYYAATPEIIDLGQLPELPKTFNGINNVWAETNLGNTEIEIEYVQDVKKLLEKQAEQQNARLDNIEALLSTTQTSALLLDNMQNDLEKEVE